MKRPKIPLRRLYHGLTAITAGLAVVFLGGMLFVRAMLVCGLLFAVLAVCTGVLYRLTLLPGPIARLLVRMGTGLLALWLLSFVLVQGLIASGASTDEGAGQSKTVLVLGCGLRNGKPSRTLTERLERAFEVQQRNPGCTLILCGGRGKDEGIAESAAMYEWLEQHGADMSRVYTEGESLDTAENIRNARALMVEKQLDLSSVAVLSSDFHLWRARRLMATEGLPPVGIAAKCPNLTLSISFRIREYGSIVLWALGE